MTSLGNGLLYQWHNTSTLGLLAVFLVSLLQRAKSQPDSAQGFWMTGDINILGSKVVRAESASRVAS